MVFNDELLNSNIDANTQQYLNSDEKTKVLIAYQGTKSAFRDMSDMFLKKKMDSSNNNYIYIGFAYPNTTTSSTGWIIKRINTVTGDTDFAGGSVDFSQVWDSRISLTYN